MHHPTHDDNLGQNKDDEVRVWMWRPLGTSAWAVDLDPCDMIEEMAEAADGGAWEVKRASLARSELAEAEALAERERPA